MVLSTAIWLLLQAPPGVAGSSHVDRLAAEGRYAEAAAEVEQTLAADPQAALKAGFLRTQAGHEAHAWRHFEALLRRTDVSAVDRADGQDRQAALLRSTREVAVLLDVTPSNHWFRDRSMFGPDLFHPTRAGHTKWAEVAAPHLLLALCRAEVAGV